MIQKLRSVLIDWSVSLMNWNSDRILAPSRHHSVRWCGWRIESVLSAVFQFAYPGSDEELNDAEETPAQYRSLRQRDYVLGYPEVKYPTAFDTLWDWTKLVLQAIGLLTLLWLIVVLVFCI